MFVPRITKNGFARLALGLVLSGLLGSCMSSEFNPKASMSPETLSLVSLNVHYIVPSRDEGRWDRRRAAVIGVLEELDPDIILFQEMETFEWGIDFPTNVQLEWVQENMEGYLAGASGDPRVFPSTQPILYRADRLILLEQGFFYFSPEPDKIYAQPWEGRWPAYCSWVLLQDQRTQKDFYVYNIHLDAFSGTNRINGSHLIRERILGRSRSDLPVILGGDFNALDWFSEIQIIEEAELIRAPANEGTFHFGVGISLYSAIDHFFHSPEIELVENGVYQKPHLGIYPSDHHPVFVRYSLGSPDQ